MTRSSSEKSSVHRNIRHGKDLIGEIMLTKLENVYPVFTSIGVVQLLATQVDAP